MSDDMSVLVRRVIDDEVESDQLPFDRFEQTVAVLRDISADLTPDEVVEMAYDEANMRSRAGQHLVTQLGDSVEIEREA